MSLLLVAWVVLVPKILSMSYFLHSFIDRVLKDSNARLNNGALLLRCELRRFRL